jgi:hypothetical protein
VVALVLGGWIFVLARGFDPAAGTVTLPGFDQPISLGEGGEGRGGRDDED